MKRILVFILAAAAFNASAQCHFIPSTSTVTDTVSYNFSGGSFASYGCAPIDPTYWLSLTGMSVTLTFVLPQSYPGFRVWGMNTDDTASVMVNGTAYPLNSSSAYYYPKVACGVSPGPDGVLFAGGLLVGANTPGQANYSYQDVQLDMINVTSITLTSINSTGFGFAGTLVGCPFTAGIENMYNANKPIAIYPNPANERFHFTVKTNVQLSSITGQVLARENNTDQLDLSALPAGVYFLAFTDTKGQVIQRSKIVKE